MSEIVSFPFDGGIVATTGERDTKPQTFADCVGNELPYGWEQSYDANVGVYYINHMNETNQLEDPRVQWREKQQEMLKDYLITAQEDLEATKEIFSVKEQRLQLAQEDFKHFNDALGGWKSSHTSLNSNSSVGSTKYDPDLLKADVSLAKQRVARLKQELEQVRAKVHYKEQGVETLTAVDEKLSKMESGFTVDEAQVIINEINQTKKCLNSEEKQKQDLMRTLAKLKEDLILGRNNGSSPDVSTLSIPQDKASTASQTDITLELNLSSENKLAEQTRIRLHYDELKKTISNIKMQLVKTQSQMVPGYKESDKDRLLLLQEKEQLLRELKSIDAKGRSEPELISIRNRIAQLENDICVAVAISNKSIADRLNLEDYQVSLLQQLQTTSKLVTLLESQLKSTSTSQLSISSGSSLGSLGSLSASSYGSLASTSMTDIYSQPQLNENLQDLHRCVRQSLLGHSIAPGLTNKDFSITTSVGTTGPAQPPSVLLSSETASGDNLGGVPGSKTSYTQLASLVHSAGSQHLQTASSDNVSGVPGSTTSYTQLASLVHSAGSQHLQTASSDNVSGVPGSTTSYTQLASLVHSSGSQQLQTASSDNISGVPGSTTSYTQLASLVHSAGTQQLQTASTDNVSGVPGSKTSYSQLASTGKLHCPRTQQGPSCEASGATPCSEQSSISPQSSLASSSPPTSPYDIGPPPSYEQHMNLVEQHKRLTSTTSTSTVPGFDANVTTSASSTSATTTKTTKKTPTLSPSSDSAPLMPAPSGSTIPRFQPLPYMLQRLDPDIDPHGNTSGKQAVANTQPTFDNVDIASNPPLSPISESSSGVCNNLSGLNTGSVSAAVSDESVTGDSGVFEASIKRTGDLDNFLQMESAQIKIKLQYDSLEGLLHVEIDQARNLGALAFPDKTKVGIKAALLPLMSSCWETKPCSDMRNPKFGEDFQAAVHKNLLHAQTLQVNVWSFPEANEPECLGCAHISLADFDKNEVCVRWYNVLSFKFMQSDMKQSMKKDTLTSPSGTQMCDKLLNAVKSKIGQLSLGPSSDMRKSLSLEERSSTDTIKDNRIIHPYLIFGKEESSDESTIISSQTSTLTRNQGPEDMHSHQDVHEEEEDDEEEDDEEEDLKEQDSSVNWLVFSNYEPADVDSVVQEVQTCDIGTNTDGDFEICKFKKRTSDKIRKSTIRRSQTFSPADRQGTGYVCKLNRSDSDSSMPLYKRHPFQRNSAGRQSLRCKKLPGTSGSSITRAQLRTSVDLELDLQASQRRLSHLRDDISRLRELKKGMEEAKARGENELPSWLTDDENFQRLLAEADKLAQKSETDPTCSKRNTRAEQIMKKVTRDVQKLQKNFFPHAFSEKMAFFTVDNTTVPVIPRETTDERFEEFLKDDRTGAEV